MSQLSSSFGLPSGPVQAGFEAAARAHQAARETRTDTATRETGNPVTAAIANAAQRTSVDFNYLLAQAKVESALNPAARATTSSATGLYQFIDDTWLGTVKKHGERFGLGATADDIALTPSGNPYVADPSRRAAILELRNNPKIAALMAAGLAEDNSAQLMPVLGRQPSHAELYLAHFLGASGAGRFLSELQADPGQSAPELFARPAAANRAIFYAPDNAPRSLAQVMDVIGGKLDRALGHASDGATADFARAGEPFAPAAAITRAPFRVANADGFGRGQPLSLPPAAPSVSQPPAPRAPMSQVLGAAFGADLAAAPVQVRRAYATLKVFGL